jgi:hypothetical protein
VTGYLSPPVTVYLLLVVALPPLTAPHRSREVLVVRSLSSLARSLERRVGLPMLAQVTCLFLLLGQLAVLSTLHPQPSC